MSTDPSETRTERFWIDDTVVENSDDGLGLPFSTDTFGIVDEALGRVVLYCHMDDAEDILTRLRNS